MLEFGEYEREFLALAAKFAFSSNTVIGERFSFHLELIINHNIF